MDALQLTDLTKHYAPNTPPAVNRVSLSMARGDIVGLVGPSGCGKTSTLRLIAGFEQPDSGHIVIGGRTVAAPGTFLPPEKRGVGMVFQDYALFPHLTVRQNIAFGLTGKTPAQHQEMATYLMNMLGLSALADRFPHALSGGERQRVALARALAPEPVLVLMDEPFSNLDADRRATVREQVRAILRSLKATALFVTHDQEEALFMCDRIALMHSGELTQIDTPEAIFHTPSTRRAAEFIGHTDFLPGHITPEGVQTEIGLIPQRHALPAGTPVELAVRADDVTLRPTAGAASFVLARHFKGAFNIYRVRLPSGRLLHSLQPHTLQLRPGTRVHVLAEAGHALACYHAGQRVPPLE